MMSGSDMSGGNEVGRQTYEDKTPHQVISLRALSLMRSRVEMARICYGRTVLRRDVTHALPPCL